MILIKPKTRTACLLIAVLLLYVLEISSGVLTVSPNSINGTLTVCPGQPISIICDHDNVAGGLSRWRVSLANGPIPDCGIFHSNPINQCGPFAFTMISGLGGPTLNSTATTAASSELDGSMVECFSGGSPTDIVGSVNISVLAIPTPTIESVWQTSQSTVRVNMSVPDTQCVGTYVATATQQTGTGSAQGNSTSSTVEITGLDVCSYDYDVTGNVVTQVGDIDGAMSTVFNFNADLSGLNGVSNVRATVERTVLEWTQELNPDYPTCITSYSVSYSGGSYDTNTSSVTRETLEENSFPFCEPVSVTVTPLTPRGPLSGGASTGQVNLIIPGFIDPSVSVNEGFTQSAPNDSIVFATMIQDISDTIVTDRMYGVSETDMSCTPDVNFTGDSFMASLPSSAYWEMYTVCVSFQNGDCMAMNTHDLTVPGNETEEMNPVVTDTMFSAAIALPITAYLPSQLVVIISVVPSDNPPLETPFPTDYKYPLALFMLSPNVTHTYTVQIVLSSNMSQTVVPIFTGSFNTSMNNDTVTPTTQPPTAPTMPITTQGTVPPAAPVDSLPIIVAVIVVFLVVIAVLALIAGVLIYLYCKKKTGSMRVTSHELKHSLAETGPADEVRGSPPLEEPQSTATFTNPDSVRNPSPPAEGAEGGAKVEAVIYADLDITTKNRAQRKEPEKPSVDDHEAVQYSTVSFATHKTEEPKMDEPATSES